MNTRVPASLATACLACILTLCLLPVSGRMAVSPSSPWQTHLIYMLGHAGLLHWLVNAWCLLTLSAVLTPLRLAAAYASAVLLTLVPGVIHAPTLGMSAVVYFIYGYASPRLWHGHKSSMAAVVAAMAFGFLLPWIAAALHLLAFLAGFAFWHAEGACRSIYRFIITDSCLVVWLFSCLVVCDT